MSAVASRKIYVTHGDQVVGETSPEELRAKVLRHPVVRELQPGERPRIVAPGRPLISAIAPSSSSNGILRVCRTSIFPVDV